MPSPMSSPYPFNKMYTNSRFLRSNNRAYSRPHFSPTLRLNPSFSPALRPIDLLDSTNRISFARQNQSTPTLRRILPTLKSTSHLKLSNIHQTASIFEIFSDKGYRRPIGSGFLISEHIGITAFAVIPTKEYAADLIVCFESAGNVYRCEPNDFFFASEESSFTVFAIEKTVATEQREKQDIRVQFSVRADDTVAIYYRKVETRIVSALEMEFFHFAGSELPKGLPVFDINWRVQGIVTSSGQYKLSHAVRIDVVFQTLMKHNVQIERKTLAEGLAEGISLLWFEWNSKNIYKLRNDKSLEAVVPSNAEDLNKQGDWSFPWNCRYSYITPTDVIIAGGVSMNSTVTNTAFLYKTKRNALFRVPHMIFPREAPAIVCIQLKVYVIGGKHAEKLCECLDLSTYKWTRLPDMIHGRTGHSACSLSSKFIYAIGGNPIESSGFSLEKFYIHSSNWELLPIKLPSPIFHSGILPIHNKIYLFGGKYSKKILVISNETVQEYETLTTAVETIVPVHNTETEVLIIVGQEGYINLKVIRYPLEHLRSTSPTLPPLLRRRKYSPQDRPLGIHF